MLTRTCQEFMDANGNTVEGELEIYPEDLVSGGVLDDEIHDIDSLAIRIPYEKLAEWLTEARELSERSKSPSGDSRG